MRTSLGCLIIWSMVAAAAWAQSPNRIHYSFELGGFGTANAQIPFWLRSNQYGIVPVEGSWATARLSIYKQYRQQTDSTRKKRRFDWGFGVKGVANGSRQSTVTSFKYILPEAFVKMRLGKVELWGGKRMEIVGLADSLLSSGAVAWSGNAPTFPKIQLHTPDFVSLGFIRHLIAFRAGYAHGWFVNTYVKGSYLPICSPCSNMNSLQSGDVSELGAI